MTSLVRSAFVFLAAASSALAGETKFWSQGDYSDFEKATLKNLSLTSDGRVTLAPVFRELFDTASVYLWALAEDSKGNLYIGGGGPGGPGARVYALSPDGKGRTLAQLEDLEVHALAIDKQDRVYAGTAPDGKVYRITPAGKAELFFDPKAKYIWGMAFSSRGDLFLATGDQGEVWRVSPSGKGEVLYKTAETHARSLAVDAADNLIVGTEPGGLIIRVSPKGEGFVLYQSPKREVTSVAVARDGSIYAAAVGNKGVGITLPSLPQAAPPAPAPVPTTMAPSSQASPHGNQQRLVQPVPSPIIAAPTIAGGSEVYRIDKEGFPRKVWSHAQHIAYAIGFDGEGRAVIGTGNKGTVFRVDSDHVYTELLNVPPTQVTCLYAGRSNQLYAATGNVGKVYQIGPALEKEGTLESDVLDAELFSYWGRLTYRGQAAGGEIALETRSGNLDRPQNDWSPWAPVQTTPEGGVVASPPARFLQWRLTLRSGAAGGPPVLSVVDVAYLQKNVAPSISVVEITPANYRFPQAQPSLGQNPQNLALQPLGGAPRRSRPPTPVDGGGNSMQFAKGYLGARWAAADDNDDALCYTVEIRGEKETEWRPLRKDMKEKYLSWDSTTFPDGEYRLRVTASDAPANPTGQGLSSDLISDPFLIDNTPPEISGLAAAPSGNQLAVRWKAADGLSVVEKAEYSVNGGEWTVTEPADKLSDSRQEEYSLNIGRGAGEQVIAVRVTDEYANQAVASVVVR